MKTLIFHSIDNDFSDILSDKTLKKLISTKLFWDKHLLIQMKDDDKILSYIILKYGSSIVDPYTLFKNFTPVRGKDYETYRDTKHKEYIKKQASDIKTDITS